jgi:hypothetical protein
MAIYEIGKFKREKSDQVQLLMSVIPSTQAVQIRRTKVQSQPEQNVSETHI